MHFSCNQTTEEKTSTVFIVSEIKVHTHDAKNILSNPV